VGPLPRWLSAPLLVLLAGGLAATAMAVEADKLESLGKRLYRDGILPDGRALVATVAGGSRSQGSAAACATCHRKSGLGAAEGQNVIRPLTVPGFFAGQENTRRYARPHSVKVRQLQYTDESLDRALREGLSIDGRALNPLMPRYSLDRQAIAALRAYLSALAVRPAPGVTDTTIHFATVIAPDAAPRVREATLQVLNAAVETHNAGTRSEQHRRRAGIESMHVDWRQWQLHVWELSGLSDTWAEQLERQLGEQPVFAVLSGAGREWRPVHDFCERQELPCLFPNVDLPGRAEPGDYTLYLSRGLLLEADMMARHLAEHGADGPVLQIRGEDARAALAADAFRAAWRARGKGEVSDIVQRTGGDPAAALQAAAARASAVILWLDGAELAQFAAENLPPGVPLLSSGTLLGEPLPGGLAPGLDERLMVVWPFALPPAPGERRFDRAQQWLAARGIPAGDRRTQLNTYFAAMMAGDAITHLANNYSQDYLIERVEHGANRSLATGAFPLVELGPGQRYASKGAYLARLRGPSLVPVGDWTVP
jgi:cytochrome c553